MLIVEEFSQGTKPSRIQDHRSKSMKNLEQICEQFGQGSKTYEEFEELKLNLINLFYFIYLSNAYTYMENVTNYLLNQPSDTT